MDRSEIVAALTALGRVLEGRGVQGEMYVVGGAAIALALVRMTLVPAVMALLGHSAWKLPRRLGRIVPDVDIEGEHLIEKLSPSTSR